ncbi:MAG: hypothetical protein CVV27_17220 [Candidatus Melainabacteria bacterium HGW-Melainabacteria-1]|nr:MAG: hypothetical protein CVV27_17220 [Candidatus Melainabacteria bacterium HGW-Melainabacteria-1]
MHPGAPPQAMPAMRQQAQAPVGYVSDDRPNDGQNQVQHNTEDYSRIYENPFLEVSKNPLSTFSIDVDTASYSNMRRFIESRQLPPADAVRIEELVNYFPYSYPLPSGEHPFSVTADLAECPWARNHKLVRIGLRGQPVSLRQLPPQNLVFLLDVSGSMNSPNKLPLLKRSLKLLVDQMREQDHVSIVVYAGAAGLVLPPTNGARRENILAALNQLEAGGSTAGSAGIQLAYETAKKHFRKDGNNRVILATDGDFNVGPSSEGELVRMIEDRRKEGIFLTVLGYGMGNYKDSRMEQLADKGNGNYAYIDNLSEARKVLVSELGGTLQTIAKDVKLQLEFNPAKVASYRLIGYENRLLRNEDFEDDSKDAGELGAGTTVTALYEIAPASGAGSAQDLRYQQQTVKPEALNSDELMSIKLRYKPPTAEASKLLAQVLKDQPKAWSAVPADFRFAAAVAGFGMQLRKSEHRGNWQMEDVIAQAKAGVGDDQEGYRKSFVTLAQLASELIQKQN